jgi:hypothetical protein
VIRGGIEKRNIHLIKKIPSKQRRWENHKPTHNKAKLSKDFQSPSNLLEQEHRQVVREEN